MSNRILDGLLSEDFALSAGFLETPSVLRRFLARAVEVASILDALKGGIIVEDTIREFVGRIMGDLRRGERFPHELAVAAIAVAIERWPTPFADEYLQDLSRLRLAEMSICIRVARECLKHRSSVAANQRRVFRLGGNVPSPRLTLREKNGSRVSDVPHLTTLTCKMELQYAKT